MKLTEMHPVDFLKNVDASSLQYFLLRRNFNSFQSIVPKHQQVEYPNVQINMQSLFVIQHFRYCLN